MGLEDDFLKDDLDDEKTIEYIKNYLPQELKEKYSDDEFYYFLDLIDEYYSESIYEIGWNEKLIKDIEFTYNGAKLPFHSSKESVRESELLIETDGVDSDSIPIHAINRRWFYTAFAMSPYAEATLNVRYKVYANSYVDLGWDTYDFSYFARKNHIF